MSFSASIAPEVRKYGAAARVAVRDRWRYPAELAGPCLTMGLFVFVFSHIWVAAFAGKAAIAGYSRVGCTWYFVFAELCLFCAGGAFATLSQDIKDGQVAYTLARPYHLLAYTWAQRLGAGLSAAPVYFAVGWLVAAPVAGPWVPDSALRAACVLLALVLSISLQFFLQAAMALTAFWFEENSAFLWIFMKITLVAGTLMPLEFLPSAWQPALRWSPFPWLVWAPARLAVAPHLDLATAGCLLGGQLAWLVLAVAIASHVFRVAVRHATVQGG